MRDRVLLVKEEHGIVAVWRGGAGVNLHVWDAQRQAVGQEIDVLNIGLVYGGSKATFEDVEKLVNDHLASSGEFVVETPGVRPYSHGFAHPWVLTVETERDWWDYKLDDTDFPGVPEDRAIPDHEVMRVVRETIKDQHNGTVTHFEEWTGGLRGEWAVFSE